MSPPIKWAIYIGIAGALGGFLQGLSRGGAVGFGIGFALAAGFVSAIIGALVGVIILLVSRTNHPKRVREAFENTSRSSDPHVIRTPSDRAGSPTTVSTDQSAEASGPIASRSSRVPNVATSPPTLETKVEAPSCIPSVDEETLWAHALEEVDGPQRRSGLWAKCFAGAQGVESVAKAAYLSERVEQLRETDHKYRRELQALAIQEAQRQADAEERRSLALREEIDRRRPELCDLVIFVRSNDTIPTSMIFRTTDLLGGSIRRDPSGLLKDASWIASFQGESQQLHTDADLGRWFRKTVLPAAESEVGAEVPIIPFGKCPSCEAVIALHAEKCIGCDAMFGPGSAWRPIPFSNTSQVSDAR